MCIGFVTKWLIVFPSDVYKTRVYPGSILFGFEIINYKLYIRKSKTNILPYITDPSKSYNIYNHLYIFHYGLYKHFVTYTIGISSSARIATIPLYYVVYEKCVY
jgi:hypothetical protein